MCIIGNWYYFEWNRKWFFFVYRTFFIADYEFSLRLFSTITLHPRYAFISISNSPFLILTLNQSSLFSLQFSFLSLFYSAAYRYVCVYILCENFMITTKIWSTATAAFLGTGLLDINLFKCMRQKSYSCPHEDIDFILHTP